MAAALARSQIRGDGTSLGISVDLYAEYAGSLFPGGDNPGGAAKGELFSVMEFVMPAEEIVWIYELRVDDTIDFDGSTRVVFENLTQSETILDVTSAVVLIQTTLTGNTGDLMRITSTMSGAGDTPGGRREYESSLGMAFIVPEPGTVLLLLVSALLGMRK